MCRDERAQNLQVFCVPAPTMTLAAYLLFLPACFAINMAFGPNNLLSVTNGARYGIGPAVAAAGGRLVAFAIMIVIAGVGMGALLAASALAFSVVKWAGVAYLVWLGIQQWRAPARPIAEAGTDATPRRARELIVRGWIINALNPKGTVFLLAVVPQFLNLAQPLAPQYLVIALTLGFTDLVVMAGYTALAARLLSSLKSSAPRSPHSPAAAAVSTTTPPCPGGPRLACATPSPMACRTPTPRSPPPGRANWAAPPRTRPPATR